MPDAKMKTTSGKGTAAATVAAGGGPDNLGADALAAKELHDAHKQKAAAKKADTQNGKAAAGRKGKSGPARALGWAWSGNRQVLLAEFTLCLVVLGLGVLLAPQGQKNGATRGLIKASGLCGLFFLLALVASGGQGAAKGATALGTLVTAAYVFTSSDVHNVVQWTAAFFSPSGDVSALQPESGGPDAGYSGETSEAYIPGRTAPLPDGSDTGPAGSFSGSG
jgi:hypothetical protein